jgi:hypothetical protein
MPIIRRAEGLPWSGKQLNHRLLVATVVSGRRLGLMPINSSGVIAVLGFDE